MFLIRKNEFKKDLVAAYFQYKVSKQFCVFCPFTRMAIILTDFSEQEVDYDTYPFKFVKI